MAAVTTNTTTTTTDETVVDTICKDTDGETERGSVSTTIRKTGSTYTMDTNYSLDSHIEDTDVDEMTEFCEDVIKHFTDVKTALAAISA